MRIVVKVGTSTLAYATGRLNIQRVERMCRVLSDLKNAGHEIILVSSGAIAMGVGKLNLPDANMLNKLSPFFAILFSIFILREYPKKVDILSVLAAFIGAVFVVRPTAGIASLPSLAGVLGGLGAGAAYTFVRQMSRKGERGPEIVMFFSAFTCVCAIPFFAFNFQPMSAKQWLFLLLAGCAAAGGQLSITAAYRHAPAKEISVFDYSQIVYAALWGFLVFGEIPDALSFVGYAIIIGAAVFRCIFNLRADKKAAAEKA